ncbi:MAG: heme-binding domain-containing protein [Ignavibacteriales bacterium]|nr:heme-binding domain-containing protein [Ignavibacteriales bacterium]
MKKNLNRTGIALLVVFAGVQLYSPERTNPPTDPANTLFAAVPVPQEVRTIFERSCFDCHSNETRWPWYSTFAPARWIVVGDVEEGREHLNFSEFRKYKALRAVAKADMICEQLLNGNMPLPNYLTLHPGARVSREERDLICDWVESVRDTLFNLQ